MVLWFEMWQDEATVYCVTYKQTSEWTVFFYASETSMYIAGTSGKWSSSCSSGARRVKTAQVKINMFMFNGLVIRVISSKVEHGTWQHAYCNLVISHSLLLD